MYLSCHGCELIDDSICTGLDSCVALDLGHDDISDEGLQILLEPKVLQSPWHLPAHQLRCNIYPSSVTAPPALEFHLLSAS